MDSFSSSFRGSNAWGDVSWIGIKSWGNFRGYFFWPLYLSGSEFQQPVVWRCSACCKRRKRRRPRPSPWLRCWARPGPSPSAGNLRWMTASSQARPSLPHWRSPNLPSTITPCFFSWHFPVASGEAIKLAKRKKFNEIKGGGEYFAT